MTALDEARIQTTNIVEVSASYPRPAESSRQP